MINTDRPSIPVRYPRVMSGHVFMINGDLNRIACDALLIPTDRVWSLRPWTKATTDWARPPRKWSGKTVVVATDVDRPWPRVWYGNVGGNEQTPHEHFAQCLTDFVEAAVQDIRKHPRKSERGASWPKPRLAVNLLGSGGGGSAATRGDLIKVLVARMVELAESNDVDLVLVLNGDEAFAAAQHARRNLGRGRGELWRFASNKKQRMHSKAAELADASLARQLVLFVGAGVSASAGLPLWGQLLTEAGRELGVPRRAIDEALRSDLRDAATVINLLAPGQRQSRPSKLQSEVARQLRKHDRYAVAHGLIASLPTFEAVTTNFDTLLEDAAAGAGHPPAVLPHSPRAADGRWLLKLHGSVTAPETMVLNRADYLSMPREFGALMGIVQAMLLMRHMVFIGYSLTDEDLHELLHEVRLARGSSTPRNGDHPEFGTVLTLFRKGVLSKLWEGELDLFPILDEEAPRNEAKAAAKDAARVHVAARELEIFLDLVVHLTATGASFLLTESWEGLLNDSDKALKQQLLALSELLGPDLAHGDAVEDFLGRFGWSARA